MAWWGQCGQIMPKESDQITKLNQIINIQDINVPVRILPNNNSEPRIIQRWQRGSEQRGNSLIQSKVFIQASNAIHDKKIKNMVFRAYVCLKDGKTFSNLQLSLQYQKFHGHAQTLLLGSRPRYQIMSFSGASKAFAHQPTTTFILLG
jgi:hypothetical protein